MSNLMLLHQQELAENNLQVTDLPTNIQSRIGQLDILIAKYEKEQSPSLYEEITKQSAQIAHAILDFVEKDLEDEPEITITQQQNQTPQQQQGNSATETKKPDNGGLGGVWGIFGL